MNHCIFRPLALIAWVVAAGVSCPVVFQGPWRGDLLLGQHTGYLDRIVPSKAKAVNLPYHRGGFFANDKVFVSVHEAAIDGLACDGLAAYALREFCCLDFLLVSFTSHSLKIFNSGAKSFFPCALSTPSLIAIKWTFFCGKIISAGKILQHLFWWDMELLSSCNSPSRLRRLYSGEIFVAHSCIS